jgi:small subunit ribosomal protein S27Ae
MQVFIQTTRGLEVVDTLPESLVQDLLVEVEVEALQWGGRPLNAQLTLADYGIMANATLSERLELLGGKKKKKKKAFTTPKRKPHKHRKVKLAALRIYKVEGTDKVKKLRRECNTCGVGVFMAKHKDRQTCGKCHATIFN